MTPRPRSGAPSDDAPTPPRRLVFLDFDGVLNHYSAVIIALAEGRSLAIDRACVARLNRLVAAAEAEVVISSTWRLHHSLAELRDILEKHGFRGRVVDVTPVYEGEPRGHEIEAWLEQYAPRARFVILDDNADMASLSPRLIQTSLDKGLQDDHVAAALALFDQEPG